MSVVKRIKKYIDFKGVTVQKFEVNVGYSNGAFGSQLKNDKSIGSDKIENILNAYPEINPEWLLTGRGEMLRAKEDMRHADPHESDLLKKINELQEFKIHQLEKELASFKETNRHFEGNY